MKIYAILISILLASGAVAQKASDRLGQPGPVTFDDVVYELATVEQPSKGYLVQQYLPTGDTLERYHTLLELHVFDTDLTAAQASKKKLEELMEYKKSDALCNYQELKSPDGKEFVVDFVKSTSEGGRIATVDLNVSRYVRMPVGSGREGLLVVAYSERAYNLGVADLLDNMKTKREHLLRTVTTMPLPPIQVR